MKLKSLHDLFVDQLKDMYYAEAQLVKALPKMAKAASNKELRTGIEEHLEQTKHHVERLEQVFDLIDTAAKRKKCEAMEGLLEEGKDIIKEDAEPGVRDAGIIAAAQKVEHYEIASYGCLRTWAEHLGLKEASELLQQTLEEEKETDEKLTQLAEQKINLQATEEEEAMAGSGESRRGQGNGRR